ncbi:MAG: hypothetical protein WCO11_08970 [Sphingomonadales bacterium]
MLRLVAANLPTTVIVSKIKSSSGTFDVSSDTLIALTRQGVPGEVLVAMLEHNGLGSTELSEDAADPAVPHYPGIYLFGASGEKMARLIPAPVNPARTSGNLAYLMTGGLVASTDKASITGRNAPLQTQNKQPSFYVFFDESVPRAALVGSGSGSVWAAGNGPPVTSPAELALVRLHERSGRRETEIARKSIAGSRRGLTATDLIAFDAEPVRPGVFRLTPVRPLAPGEYGFVPLPSAGGSGREQATLPKLFDFGILN